MNLNCFLKFYIQYELTPTAKLWLKSVDLNFDLLRRNKKSNTNNNNIWQARLLKFKKPKVKNQIKSDFKWQKIKCINFIIEVNCKHVNDDDEFLVDFG